MTSLSSILYNYGELAVFGGTFLVLNAAALMGTLFGRMRRTAADDSLNMIQTAMLTLLALLLAFGVSMAEVRYEGRKGLEIDEANAIGTSYLRVDLMPEASAESVKRLFRGYLEERIAFYQARALAESIASSETKSTLLQKEIWKIVVKEAGERPTAPMGLLLSSVNQAFDLSEEQANTFLNRVPASIIGLLCITTVLVMGLVGYLNSKATSRHAVAMITLSLIFSMTLFVILDLDRPRRGLITVGPTSLIRLRDSILAQN